MTAACDCDVVLVDHPLILLIWLWLSSVPQHETLLAAKQYRIDDDAISAVDNLFVIMISWMGYKAVYIYIGTKKIQFDVLVIDQF